MGLLAVSCGDPSDTISSQPVDTGLVDTITPATTTPLPATTTVPAPTTTAVPARVAAAWGIPAGIEVAVASDDGLHLLTGSDDRIISPDVFEDVVADPRGGGWLVTSAVDFEDTATPLPLRRIGNDGSDEVVLTPTAGTFLQLHDAAMVDGNAIVFYNLNRQHAGALDTSLDEVYALDVVTGEARKITDAGGWEAGVDLNFGGGLLVGLYQTGPGQFPMERRPVRPAGCGRHAAHRLERELHRGPGRARGVDDLARR